jgi:hypothetical protein
MATKYCDHGLYGAPVAGGTVPSAAEDGNGKAKTAATMATLVIAFSGLPTAAQAITIAGVTFTAVASGATGNQFNAVTDAATTATNLKNAINASTTNALKPVGVIAATAPLRNVVNATSSGGTVTVYTRCAGSDWNSVAETSTLANCAVTQWAGGTDGALGYFVNTGTLAWPTAIAQTGYGVFGLTKPYLGTAVAGDSIVVRSNKTITVSLNDNWIAASYSGVGTFASPLRIVFDDSTEWSDGANPVFLANFPLTSVRGFYPSTGLAILAKRYSDGTHGFKVLNTAGSPAAMNLGFSKGWDISGVHIESAGGLVISHNDATYAETEMVLVRESKFVSGINQYFIGAPSSVGHNLLANFYECEFSNIGNSSANSGFFQVSGSAPRQHLFFDSCKFSNFVAGSRLFPVAADSRYAFQVYLRNCDFGGVSILGPNTSSSGSMLRKFAASSQYGNRDFFIDDPLGFVEWNSAKSFPSCNARLLDGTTPWSIHVTPTTVAGRNSRSQFVKVPRIGKINSLADGVRTLTVELAIHSALSWNKSHISAAIDYVDTSGNRQVIDTYDYDGAALTTSSETWSPEVGGQVTFVDGVTQYHNKYKIAVTTPTSIATGTEIGIVIRCHTNVSNTTQGFFVDPEIKVV